MNDEIFIDDLEIFACHGVFDREKLERQRFLISIRARFDGTKAMASDDVADTVNYETLMGTVISAVTHSSFNLVERLARHVADEIFSQFGAVFSLDVALKKFPNTLAHIKFSSVGFSSTFSRHEK